MIIRIHLLILTVFGLISLSLVAFYCGTMYHPSTKFAKTYDPSQSIVSTCLSNNISVDMDIPKFFYCSKLYYYNFKSKDRDQDKLLLMIVDIITIDLTSKGYSIINERESNKLYLETKENKIFRYIINCKKSNLDSRIRISQVQLNRYQIKCQ